MRLRLSASLLVQLMQPTPHRAFGNLEAPRDRRLARLASLTRPQDALPQVGRIGPPHDPTSRQSITPPRQQTSASFIPFFHSLTAVIVRRPPVEEGVRPDLIQIVGKDAAALTQNLVEIV